MTGTIGSTVFWKWNAIVPPTVERCVHEFIVEQARATPDAPAVCAWDGDFTYAELDLLSTRLAHELVRRGVKEETMVPLCFEKSKWTTVAMLGVMKAGGAFVLLDAAQPEARLRAIVEQVQAKMLVCSAQQERTGTRLLPEDGTVLAVSAEHIDQLAGAEDSGRLPSIDAISALYVVFTSGSTGTPKGVIITHNSYSSGIRSQVDLGLHDPGDRMLDFSSYSFDVSVDTLRVLMTGGCICVPSDMQRVNNLTGFINHAKVNTADLTPSTARLLEPSTVPHLKCLQLSGESMSGTDITTWATDVEIRNLYGPGECTPTSTVKYGITMDDDPNNIGSGVGCVTWIIDPADHERLVPIGAVGELLIEGPIVGRGYLGDPEKTAAAFVEDPPWLLRGGGGVDGRRGRLYKTGDLVRYASDGSLVFVGRKDTQVKVRGQRVELGEVEHHVRQALPEGSEVVAEVVRPESGRHEPMLVAFVRPPASPTAETDAGDASQRATPDDLVRKLVAGLDDLLESALPRYMVPSAYVPVDSIPTTATGKTDRKRLRETAAAMTAAELAGWRASTGPKRRPTTDVEQQLATLWAEVLGVDADTIGLDDSFFRLGGDSIAAMKLVAAVRTQDFALTVADVFSQPLLCNQARLLHVVEHSPSDLLHQPFTAVSRAGVAKALADSSLGSVSQQRSRILDAAPVTSYQHYSVTHTINKPRVQLLYLILTPSDDLDPSRLVAACKELVNRHEILRTVFIPQGGSFIQSSMETIDLFVLVQRHSDDPTRHSRQICVEDADEGLDLYLGTPWIRFWVVQSATQGQRLIIRLSHAQYDGISLPTIVNDLEHLCYRRSLPLVPSYAYYLSCLSSIMIPQCQSYWDRTLAGSSLTGLPTASRGANGLTNHVQRVTSTMRIPIPQFENLTVSTILQAAWALVISQVMSTDDVVFGQLVSGRNVQMPQVHRLVGCCINIIPVRVRVNTTQTYRDLIEGLHKQKIDGSTYESCQLPDIVEHATNWPQGSRFSWIVQHQNIQMDLSTDSMAVECFVPHMERADAADEVYLFTEPKGHELEVSVSGRKSRELLIYQLKDTLRSILAITSKQPSLSVAVVRDASLSCANLPTVRA